MPSLRNILYLLIITVVILLSALVVAVNTPMVVDAVAKRFAPQYGISYERITGNVLKGITVHSPKYEEASIAKDITFRWNPAALLERRVLITNVKFQEISVDTLQHLIDSFSEGSQSIPSDEKEGLPLVIDIENLKVSLLPFVKKNVTFSNVALRAENLVLGDERFEVEHMDLKVDSNISKLRLQGSYEDKEVKVDLLSLNDMDLQAIQSLGTALQGQESASEQKTQNDVRAWYIPETVFLKQVDLNSKPAHFDPVKLEKLNIDAEKIKVNLKKFLIEDGSLLVSAKSNLSNLHFQSEIEENTMRGNVVLTPHQRLFDLYGLPLRKEAIGKIKADISATQEKIRVDLKASAQHVLETKEGELNIDIDSLISGLEYDIPNSRLKADSSVKLTTPYSEGVLVSNHAVLDDELVYYGDIEVQKIKGLDANLSKLLSNIHMKYRGDTKNISAQMESDHFKGDFVVEDIQKGILKLATKDAITIDGLPDTFENKEVIFDLNVPFELDQNSTFNADVSLVSNIVKIDTDITLDKHITITGNADIPSDSQIRSLDPNIKWESLVPMDLNITVAGDEVQSTFTKEDLKLQSKYGLSDKQLKGSLSGDSMKADVWGDIPRDIHLDAKIVSFAALKETIGNYYILEKLPEIEGSSTIKATISDLEKFELSLNSPQIIYKADRSAQHIVDNVSIDLGVKGSELTIERYDVTYNKQRVYASKPSTVSLIEDKVVLSPLWVNDTLALEGQYALKTKEGNIDANATQMPLEHEWAEIECDIDLATLFDGNLTDVKGEIILRGGRILYDVRQQSFASDSDIVIVQDMKSEETSSFMDNLSSAVNIKTQKPLSFKQAGIDIEANADFTLYKAVQEPLMLLGSVELLEGGSYLFQDKKFTLEKSFIYFTGDLKKPLLEIEAKYQAVKHLITISVTGTPEAPNINFSSSPSLTREQILSVILFDSEAGGDTYSGEEMMKMMGGAMAKSALENVGIKLDHLVLGEGNSIEVGKKLTRDLTIIYINDEIPKVELKYRHNSRLESVIGASEESSSYDIIYTKDFK